MIKKLFKHDLDRMTRALKWFYLVSIALALVTRVINIGKDVQAIKIIGMIFAGCTYSAVANVLINTFTNVLTYFKANFYNDESYLTHTLPVTKKQLIISKCLSAITVTVSSFIVIIASLLVVLCDKAFIDGFKAFIQMTISGFNMSVGGFITIVIFILLAEVFAVLGMGFAAIVKGFSYNQKRGIKGVLWFIAYYLGSMGILLVAVVITFAIGGNLSELTAKVMQASSLITIMTVGVIIYFLIVVYYGYLCYKLFKKGVNVD